MGIIDDALEHGTELASLGTWYGQSLTWIVLGLNIAWFHGTAS